LGGLLRAGGLDDILFADAPADPGSGDPVQVHGVLGRELADERGDVRCLVAGWQRRGRRIVLG
jgi:hypothetical protein